MSDAPERIWAWLFIEGKQTEEMQGGWSCIPDKRETEYIRADVAAAMVAAEREAMADEIELYRMMKRADGRRRIDYARAIAAAIRKRGQP
jgi:hypothetical protein